MALITWNDTLATRITSIDEQHKILIDMINTLHAEMRTHNSLAVIPELLINMTHYTASHFTHEEHLLKRYNYLDYPQHKQEHEAFEKKVDELVREFEAGRQTLSVEILIFLSDWLTNHILKTDMKYVPFLREHGVS